MKTELMVDVEPNEDLVRYEGDVFKAEQEVRESFYHVGMALKQIKDDEPFKPKGGRKANNKTTFGTWTSYCNSKRLGCPRQTAERFIQAAVNRKSLPNIDVTVPSTGQTAMWTMESVKETARLSTKKDLSLCVRRVKSHIKNGDSFTTKLVKAVVDDILGVTHKAKKKKAKRLGETPTLAEYLNNLADDYELEMESLAKFPAKTWEEAESESPGTVKRLTQVLSAFVSFLKE